MYQLVIKPMTSMAEEVEPWAVLKLNRELLERISKFRQEREDYCTCIVLDLNKAVTSLDRMEVRLKKAAISFDGMKQEVEDMKGNEDEDEMEDLTAKNEETEDGKTPTLTSVNDDEETDDFTPPENARDEDQEVKSERDGDGEIEEDHEQRILETMQNEVVKLAKDEEGVDATLLKLSGSSNNDDDEGKEWDEGLDASPKTKLTKESMVFSFPMGL